MVATVTLCQDSEDQLRVMVRWGTVKARLAIFFCFVQKFCLDVLLHPCFVQMFSSVITPGRCSVTWYFGLARESGFQES